MEKAGYRKPQKGILGKKRAAPFEIRPWFAATGVAELRTRDGEEALSSMNREHPGSEAAEEPGLS